MCCNKCPFHPTKGTIKDVCSTPLCGKDCEESGCSKSVLSRCNQDYFVIQRLYQRNPVAIKLAFETFKTSLKSGDRGLLLSLFHAAPEYLRKRFYDHLVDFEPKSIWLLNPVFKALGLLPIENTFEMGTRSEKYLQAIVENPYSGNRYEITRGFLYANKGGAAV
jgi:hypothetical protein